MAEIDIQRKQKPSPLSWALGVILLVLVVGVGWYLADTPGVETLPWESDTDSIGTVAPIGSPR